MIFLTSPCQGPEILPADRSPGPSWFPTLTLSLDFKSKFPLHATSSTNSSSQHTVGLYSYTKFVEGGRHDQTVEVWSAPCAIAEKLNKGEKIEGDWRSQCRILGISTQVRTISLYSFAGLTVATDGFGLACAGTTSEQEDCRKVVECVLAEYDGIKVYSPSRSAYLHTVLSKTR